MTKYCKVCDEVKPQSEFNKNKVKSDGLQTRCRECQKAQNNSGYITNENRRNSIKARNTEVKDYNRKLMRRFKAFLGCLICREKEPVALDLHHTDPSGKDANPSSLLTYSTNTLKAEIRKCVVLCSNCHRKVHAGILQLSSSG